MRCKTMVKVDGLPYQIGFDASNQKPWFILWGDNPKLHLLHRFTSHWKLFDALINCRTAGEQHACEEALSTLTQRVGRMARRFFLQLPRK